MVLALSRNFTLSATARALGVEHSTISRQFGSLELELGTPLFERGPQGFELTDAGRLVLSCVKLVEEQTDELLRKLEGTNSDISGTAQIATTPFLAAHLFAPTLSQFLVAHPNLRIELLGDNRQVDISKREADIAVRVARPRDAGLVARRIATVHHAMYASAADTRPFEKQMFMGYDQASGHTSLQHYLSSLVSSDRIVFRCNGTQALLEAVRSGLGCAVLPCFAAEQDGGFRRVAVPQEMQPMTLWLTYHEDLKRSARLHAALRLIDQVVAWHGFSLDD